MSWGKKYNDCISCEGTEWEHRAKGLCSKCYPLDKMKTIIESWDPSDPNTIVPVGPINKITRDLIVKSNKIAEVKHGLISSINARIHLYKLYNTPSGEAMTIEQFIERVAAITNNLNQEKLFHGAVTRYQDNFTHEQRKIILKDLTYILINRRVKFNIWQFIINE